jgi:hypothetical protein
MQLYEYALSFRSALYHYNMDPEILQKSLIKDLEVKQSFYETVKPVLSSIELAELEIEIMHTEALLSFVRTACLV